jgi:DNA-binding transcriptional regulator YhcF (GntR family)
MFLRVNPTTNPEKRNNSLKQVDNVCTPYLESKSKPTSQKIAEQTKVNPSTVQRAEKSFDNEHDVINWIIDNQLSRRNITDDQRAYLLEKRYKEEKKTIGENQYTSKTTEDIKRVDHSEPPKTTAQKIAEQSKVSPKTQSEEDESGVVTVTTPKKTELK